MDSYAQAFVSFVSSTDEKRVLAEALICELQNRKACSLCDVGAGPGDVAQHLAASVEKYVAVESNPHHAAALQALGLEVVEETWPVRLERSFDAVVMSHVLGPGHDLDAMVGAAADALSSGGALLIVVHAIEGSEWQRLLRRIGMQERIREDLRAAVELRLSVLGFGVQRRALRTTVRTDTADELIGALSFVASADQAEGAENFAKRLDASRLMHRRYRTADGGYAFPFDHVLYCAQRLDEVR